MSRILKIRIVMFLLASLSVTLGIITGVIIFGPFSTTAVSMDMIWLRHRLSNAFCGGVTLSTVNDQQTIFSVYLLNSEPAVKESLREQFETESVIYVSLNFNSHHSFHLLKGSILTFKACSDRSTKIYIIKGDESYNNLVKSNYQCKNCAEETIEILGRNCDYKYSSYKEVKYHVSESSEYFVVFKSIVEDAWLKLKYNISRTLYDTSSAVTSLLSVNSAKLDLQLKQQYVVVHIESYQQTLDQIQIVSSCSARFEVYFLVFVFGPSLLGISISVLIYKSCRESETEELRRPRIREVNDQSFDGYINYGSIDRMVPPKYEDIVRDTEEKPPSYDEMFGSINN